MEFHLGIGREALILIYIRPIVVQMSCLRTFFFSFFCSEIKWMCCLIANHKSHYAVLSWGIFKWNKCENGTKNHLPVSVFVLRPTIKVSGLFMVDSMNPLKCDRCKRKTSRNMVINRTTFVMSRAHAVKCSGAYFCGFNKPYYDGRAMHALSSVYQRAMTCVRYDTNEETLRRTNKCIYAKLK